MSDGAELNEGELAKRLQDLHEVIAVVRTAVEMDGGTIVLTAADTLRGVVEVALSGACGACTMVGATVEQGVERVLRQRLDWVSEVHAVVEEVSLEVALKQGRGGFAPREM